MSVLRVTSAKGKKIRDGWQHWRSRPSPSPHDKMARNVRDNATAYDHTNKHRMQYAHFRSLGLFVGSGAVGAGCKTLIGKRLKHYGIHWTVQSANTIVALRCLLLSGVWDDFCETRAAA